jgi:diacylglycerol kinase (ATP)
VVPGRGADLRRDGEHLSGAGRAFVVFNPASGRGSGRRRIALYHELLERHLPGYDHGVTRRAGDEFDLADRALDQGYDTIVAVGGDGTWSHVADRIVASGRDDVRFGVLPSGTGNDFGRGLGLRYRDPEPAVRALAEGRTIPVDVGRVVTPSAPGVPGEPARTTGPARVRHFLNLIGLGFDIAVIDAAAGARFLKGELLYKWTALTQLVRYPGVELSLSDGDAFARQGRHLMLTVSNGRYFGGGFPIAPGADLQDGLLHACAIADAPALRRLRLFGQAGKGRHLAEREVTMHSAPGFTVRVDGPLRFEVDGDVYAVPDGEVRVEVLRGALRVVTAGG